MTIVANPRQFKIPDWFLNRKKDYKDGRYSQVVSNALDMKLRDDLERLKKIRFVYYPQVYIFFVLIRLMLCAQFFCLLKNLYFHDFSTWDAAEISVLWCAYLESFFFFLMDINNLSGRTVWIYQIYNE